MSINIRQNSSLNLKRLASQRQLYNEAKIVLYIQFSVSIFAVILFGILGNILNKEYAIYPLLGALVCVVINELYLTKRIKDLTSSAAYIQEEFDCDVLQIPKNRMREDYVPLSETINEKSKKFLDNGNSYELLKNWYPGVNEAETSYGKIICQNTNCSWNQRLRKRYSTFLQLIVWLVFIILLILSLIHGISLEIFIGSVVAPILPGAILIYQISYNNKESIKKLDHLRTKLNEIIEKLKIHEPYPEEHFQNDIRSLQDLIFDNRLVGPLIPDKFYFKYRDRDEVVAQISNEELVELIKSQK